MTIVKSTLAILYHPLRMIDQDVGALILQAADDLVQTGEVTPKGFTVRPVVQLLEAYCDVIGQRISMATLETPAIVDLLKGFIAAMAGAELVTVPFNRAMGMCRRLYRTLSKAKERYPSLHIPEWDYRLFQADPAVCAQLASADRFKKWYWKGWSLQMSKGHQVHMRIAPLVHLYGHKFVKKIYVAIERYYRGRLGYFRPEWNYMFDFMRDQHVSWPLATFSTEEGIKAFMKAFTRYHFSRAKEEGNDGPSAIKCWGRFVNALEISLCTPEVWAGLTSPIRRPPPATKYGSETRVYEAEDGLLVQNKLLTTIPLHVTDAQAVDVLFFHVKKDIETVRGWAIQQVLELKAKNAHRVATAKYGSSIQTRYCNGQRDQEEFSVEDICSTIEDVTSTVPQAFLCEVHEHNTGEKINAAQLASIYGCPLNGSLYPFQCLLVMEHPEITAEFFNGFELYNGNGVLTGFDEEKRLLIGYKNRKSPEHREQVIELNDKSFAYVKDVIETTALLRKKLRAKGDDQWRLLFLSSKRGIQTIGADTKTLWNVSTFKNSRNLKETLISQFRPHSDLPEDKLAEFILRVDLGRIRSSAAVVVFMKSKSSEAMSKALGHQNYDPNLLSHYLPDALLAFIKARWIRLFQKAMVCEAMKDSPYLLRATLFNTMDELDTFLENHRIKEIPAEVSDPERKAQQGKNNIPGGEAILSIGVPFLSTLLSLEAAVNASTDRKRVCGRAEYWVSFVDKIRAEIKAGVNRALKKYLADAERLVDMKKMEALIYAPSRWS